MILRGGSRDDLAFATGFVHAQERFFQMDLMRRRAGGGGARRSFCSAEFAHTVARLPTLCWHGMEGLAAA
ncbi:MAG: penicillin acylase family protein, partial [Acidobacteriota bacterium]|nr:penicillin acylase family protein [Acidobacteriota bacterium]